VLRIAVVENGALVEASGANAVVPWWSFTKTVLAAAALALVRDGRLTLDAPISSRAYTLRQLLQHQAGLPDYGGLASYHEAVGRGDEPWPVPLLLARTDAGRPRYEAGQGWDYSNIGYFFVRQIVEEITGQPLGQALAALVLEPLALPQVKLALTRSDLHGVDLGTTDRYHPGWVYHGLLVGTLPDAARLLQRLMTSDFLPPTLLGGMRTPHRLGGIIPGRPWKAPGYGLGLMSGETRYGWGVEGHTGGGPGSVCAMYHFPEAVTPRTVAAYLPGDMAGGVERAAFRCGRSH
jgi:CubicO group peptidase (beta-lactamase class C family)